MSDIRPKIDWDYVEWLLGELSAQLGPKIDMIRSKREKQRLATAKSRENPEAARRHREYMLEYNKRRNRAIKKRRAEIRLAELEREEGGTE